jgi:hypothetical protein
VPRSGKSFAEIAIFFPTIKHLPTQSSHIQTPMLLKIHLEIEATHLLQSFHRLLIIS